MDEHFTGTQDHLQDQYRDEITNAPMARRQIKWPVKRGDLILPSDTESSETEVYFSFQESSNRQFQLSIYEYSHDDDDLPTRYANSSEGKNVRLRHTILSLTVI